MKKVVIQLVLFALWSGSGYGQLCIRVAGIPVDTPMGESVYIAGNFQGWIPGSNDWQLEKDSRGYYLISFTPPTGLIEYKFTRGDWSKVEKGKDGVQMDNRIFMYEGGNDTITVIIHSWSDLTPTKSTKSENVMLWDEQYYIPQLDKHRKIWIYLPPDYEKSNKRYPVLYMHDGQNVFDSSTSYAGEWEVDETLDILIKEGDQGCIIVAIENGGTERLNEYSPWVNNQYGGGMGGKYVDFIVHDLKPTLDSAFRTMAERECTGIMGSSMGGLVSLYAGLEYPDVFGMVGSFSPAYWFSEESYVHASFSDPEQEIRIYTVAGENEGANFLESVERMEQALLDAGVPENDMRLLFLHDGEHKEWFWAREFREAYLWLFKGCR